MNAKNLHKHSLPVVGVLLAAFAVSLSLASYVAPATSTNLLSRALVARFVKLVPARNGFARMQVTRQSTSARAQLGGDPAAMQFQAVGRSSGKLARLDFVVEALHPSLLSNQK